MAATNVDFDGLERALISAFSEAITAFAEGADNQRVYALTLSFSPDGGMTLLNLNTEDGYRRRVAQTYAHYSEEDLTGFLGVRYNSADFHFAELACAPPAGQVFLDQYEAAGSQAFDADDWDLMDALANDFVSCLLRVHAGLAKSVDGLDTTEDFMFWIEYWDVGLDTRRELMAKCVDAETFARVFPEFSEAEALRERLAARELTELGPQLLEALEAAHRKVDSGLAGDFRRCRLTSFDIREWFVQLCGASQSHAVIEFARQHVGAPQHFEEGTDEWETYGAGTPDSECYMAALDILTQTRANDPETREALHEFLEILAGQAGPGDSLIGLNLTLTARALHELWPKLYPADEFGDSNNRLLNLAAFRRGRMRIVK